MNDEKKPSSISKELLDPILIRLVSKGEGGPPDFGRSEGAAGSGGAPHYYTPPQIFRLWHMPDIPTK